jgi:hypothetical protein
MIHQDAISASPEPPLRGFGKFNRGEKVKTYIVVDTLNPNAVNPRYGRPAALCGRFEVAASFAATTDREAIVIFDEGGYSLDTRRVSARLYRAKEWYRNGAEGRQVA